MHSQGTAGASRAVRVRLGRAEITGCHLPERPTNVTTNHYIAIQMCKSVKRALSAREGQERIEHQEEELRSDGGREA